MRIIHTADWHLGRLFYGVHLTEDQARVLDELIALLRDCTPDVLILSGDVYDRAVPPPDAVELLGDVLARVVLDLKIPVLMISGNHDSPQRLGFASRLLTPQGLHLRSFPHHDVSPLILEDAYGPVRIYGLAYAEPSVAAVRLGDDSITDHESAVRARIQRILTREPDAGRRIIAAHALTAGGLESESERPLCIGGVGSVNAALFEPFHYTALGHLHQPQNVTRTIRYAGSLMKYSFSEAEVEKSVTLMEMGPSGACTVEPVQLGCRRDVRILKGEFKDVLRGPQPGENPDDYLMIVLTDQGAILDPMGRIREVYPNALHIERPALLHNGSAPSGTPDLRHRNEAHLFRDFVENVTGSAPSTEEEAAFASVVEDLRRDQREAAS